MLSADVLIKAQFYDIDPMDVVWHGNYTRFLEQARCALLDKIGYNYDAMKLSGYAWPIVDLRVRYVRPIRFGQEVIVTATIAEFDNGLKIDYRITDRISGDVLTKAHTRQAPVHMETGELCIESPAALTEKIKRCAV